MLVEWMECGGSSHAFGKTSQHNQIDLMFNICEKDLVKRKQGLLQAYISTYIQIGKLLLIIELSLR